ncbi:undecaprenyl-phosphate glucose phosphotransferase [Methylolobus aquaticus]|nr:undecaprenyl-phosphate glucose phosphotransferase [Methylolobus aquaticus]
MDESVESANKPLLKEHPHSILIVLRVIDLIALTLAGVITFFVLRADLALDPHYRLTTTIGTLIVILFFELGQLYRPQNVRSLRTQVRLLVLAVGAAVAALVFVLDVWVPEFSLTSNLHLIALWAPLSIVLLILARFGSKLMCRWLLNKGWPQRRIVIAGLSQMAVTAAERINSSPWFAMSVIGYVDDRVALRPEVQNVTLPRLGAITDLKEIVSDKRVAQVWVGYPLRGEGRVKQILHVLRHETVSIRFLIDCFAFDTGNGFLALNNVAGIPTLDISVTPIHGVNRYLKEFEDRTLALLFLIFLSPVMLLIALGVKLSSPGPVFYRQERVGWNNHNFMMLKFRSMPVDAEAKTGAQWAKPGESRATPFGAWLRKTSLDELPQFINVLKGDMSIVGPRPERPQFVNQFKDEIPDYMKKHMVKAGITGWAQVNGWRGDTDLEKRIEHDLYYIQNWSVWFDLWIAFKTVFKGMVHKNAY